MIEREWIGEVEGENMRSNLADLFVYIFNELKWFAFAVDDWIFAQITTIETQIKSVDKHFNLIGILNGNVCVGSMVQEKKNLYHIVEIIHIHNWLS